MSDVYVCLVLDMWCGVTAREKGIGDGKENWKKVRREKKKNRDVKR